MPRYSPATRVLRDDLLAQLRSSTRPLSTSELRIHAPRVRMPGRAIPVAPVYEQIYRILTVLHTQGLVNRVEVRGRTVVWTAARTGDDEEIDALEALYRLDHDTEVRAVFRSLPTYRAAASHCAGRA